MLDQGVIVYLRKGAPSLSESTRQLIAEIEVAYNLHKEFYERAYALYRKGMESNVREKRALSCLA